MTCRNCEIEAGKYGKDRTGAQRYRCKNCGKPFKAPANKPLGDMRIPMEKAVQSLRCLVEGCSVRSTARLTGLDKNTVLALLSLAGEKCWKLMSNKAQVARLSADSG